MSKRSFLKYLVTNPFYLIKSPTKLNTCLYKKKVLVTQLLMENITDMPLRDIKNKLHCNYLVKDRNKIHTEKKLHCFKAAYYFFHRVERNL